MPSLEQVALWSHIAAGFLALAAGTGALVTTKGGLRHRQAGKVFLLSMAVVVVTVFVLVVVDPTNFRIILTLIGVFSGYLAFSGYRELSRKRPTDSPQPIDWAAAGTVLVASLGLVVWGMDWYLTGSSFGIVMAIFGGIGVAFGSLDLGTFLTGRDGDWTVQHLQRMVAAFIATVSAVSAVNLTSQIGILAWLWPTLVGSPLIAYWSWDVQRS